MSGRASLSRIIAVILLLAPVVGVLAIPSSIPVQAQTDDNAATLTLALVNQARLQQGLWPLRVNPALQKMAETQATETLLKLAAIQDSREYHTDSQGRSAIQRAIQVYNWPSYGQQRARVEVGENAAEFKPQDAVNFWLSSSTHRKAALSQVYREAGVAALRVKSSYLIMMTFGARPNVLPALLSPDGRQLYLTTEQSRYSTMRAASTTVRLYSLQGQPLTEAQPWQAVLTLPESVAGGFYVQYTARGIETWTEVNRERDVAILPGGTLTVSAQAAAYAAEATATPLSLETLLPRLTATLTPTPMTPTQELQATPAPGTPIVSEATVTITASPVPPTATPTRSAGEADLTLIYDAQALVVVNSSKQTLDLTTLQVGGLTVERWQSIASFPAAAFPVGHCLQAVRPGTDPAPPGICRFVRSQVQFQAFWTLGQFVVRYDGKPVQTCYPTAEHCEVDLP